MSDLGLRIIKTRKAGPCSACGDGDTAMRYHTHEPPSPSYTLKEIESLTKEWRDANDVPNDIQLAVSHLLAWLAKREREGRE